MKFQIIVPCEVCKKTEVKEGILHQSISEVIGKVSLVRMKPGEGENTIRLVEIESPLKKGTSKVLMCLECREKLFKQLVDHSKMIDEFIHNTFPGFGSGPDLERQ